MRKIMSRFTVLLALVGLVAYCGGKKTESTPNAAQVEDTASNLGQTKFEEVCASCHGLTGEGDGPAGAALTPKPRNYVTESFKFGDSFAEVKHTIETGSPGTSMVGYKGVLTDEEIDAVTAYVLKLHGASAEGMSGMSGMSGMEGMSGMSGMEGMSGMSGMEGKQEGMSGMSGMSGMEGMSGMSGMEGKQEGMSGMSGMSGMEGKK